MSESKATKGRMQLLAIALVFFGPLAVAAWMYFGHLGSPEGRSNHGALLEPIVSLPEAVPESPLIDAATGAWALVFSSLEPCDDACRQALYTTRQSRTMLGREMERVRRIFLHGASAPDTVFLAAEHQGLITIEDASLAGLLENKRPAELPAGGYFLIDPLGNLVMYFEPGIEPRDMVDDIKHLLRLSRIG